MSREAVRVYGDQFDYLADCFELIKLRCDAYTLRTEAMETERMSRYAERQGRSDRSHILEIYYDLDRSIGRKEETIARRKRESEKSGVRFQVDVFAQAHGLTPEETRILLVLLYNESAGKNQTRLTCGNDILNLLHSSSVEALKASRLLSSGSTLLSAGLIRATHDEEGINFLRANYEVSEKTLRGILGDKAIGGEQASLVMDALLEGPFRILEPRFTLEKVILDSSSRATLDDVVWQVRDGKVLLDDWELSHLLEKGRGVVALFSGIPGTGKTMTAEAMAGSLEKKLIIADYSQLESKWIGETEKNIVQVFRAAAETKAVLLLDEADAILAGRLDGGHYNDRAYNRQVSLLLQELENFEGLCILTTNRETSLDEGLARRIGTTVVFEVPAAPEREKIWKGLISRKVPLDADVDIPALAECFELAGGHIKNIVVSALRTAARRSSSRPCVTMADFLSAGERERAGFKTNRSIGFGKSMGYSFS